MRRSLVVILTVVVAVPLCIQPIAAARSRVTDLELTIRSTSPRFEINDTPIFQPARIRSVIPRSARVTATCAPDPEMRYWGFSTTPNRKA